jgi:hypothetical protein
MLWHTRKEKKLIREFGGKYLRKTGTDGIIFNKPVEVRIARKDHRLRIQRDTHLTLVRKNGFYILAARGKEPMLFTAKEVTRLLPRGIWMKDRNYPHKFIDISKIWD